MDTSASPIDPTILALLSIFGGALLTAVAGLVGALIQGRREHQRWVRERRYDAYLAYLKAEDAYRLLEREMETFQDATEEVGEWLALATASPAADGEAPPGLERVGRTHEERAAALKDLEARAHRAYVGTVEAASPFSLVGPRTVVEAAQALIHSKRERRSRAVDALEAEIRQALRIKF